MTPQTTCVGIDWATTKHDVCIIHGDGRVLDEFAVANTGDGLASLVERLRPHQPLRVAIEVPHGPVVDTLIESGLPVFALNPKQLDRFRDRFTTAGAKDDRRDARVLADSLRTDAHAFRELRREMPAVIELREWSRMRDELVAERTALGNRLREQLRRYFPAMLELGDPAEPWLLDLHEAIPTPADAHRKRVASIEKHLRAQRIRRTSAGEVLQTLRQRPPHVAPGTIEAACAHSALLRARLRLVIAQIATAEQQLATLTQRIADETAEADAEQVGEQRDMVEILRSLPGVGRIVLPTLLAEAFRLLRDQDYHALRRLAGIAPVTRRSGKSLQVLMRRACSSRLRSALHHMAATAAQHDSHWKARYAACRARGHNHAHACRCVADRMLAVAFAMLRDGTRYDARRFATAA